MEIYCLDAIGRSRASSNLGVLWTIPEIELLHSCQSDRSRPQAVIKYLAEAEKLGYPVRSKPAIENRLQRFFSNNKIKHLWTEDEDNHLIELFQEYPFEIAYPKYLHWASIRNYPTRDRDPIYARLSKLGVSIVDPVIVAGFNLIARSLGLASQTVTKYVQKSGIRTEKVGQKIVCEVDKFYCWFVASESWIECLRRCAKSGVKPDLDSWSVLLNISIVQIENEWDKAKRSMLRVRSPLGSPLLVAEFAKQNYITANAIRAAIRKGRNRVGNVNFEVVQNA